MSDPSSAQEIFELFQKMMNPMAFPLQNLLMPGLSVEDIDKKISELKSVEHWLKTNLGMLELTIKTLEYQRALLTPAQAKSGDEAKALNPLTDPKLWPWNFVAATSQSGEPKTQPAKAPRKRKS
jgi:hypothetical protein